MKANQIRRWIAKDCEDDDKEMIQTLCEILADCVNDPNEINWVKDSVESNEA